MSRMESLSETAQQSNIAQTGEYLTFALGQDNYGVEMRAAQEILGQLPVTPLPKTPGFVRGVVNLRDRGLPVIELRRRFRLPSVEDTERTCIIVVQVRRGKHTFTLGLIADDISEIVDLQAAQIGPPPTSGFRVETGLFVGIGKLEQNVVALLDVNKILSDDELASVAEALRAGAGEHWELSSTSGWRRYRDFPIS